MSSTSGVEKLLILLSVLVLVLFKSIELLINMNSFGFLREACRVQGIQFKTDDNFADLIEYEPSIFEVTNNSLQVSKEKLNNIAGGDYWIEMSHYARKYNYAPKLKEYIYNNPNLKVLNIWTAPYDENVYLIHFKKIKDYK